MESNLIPDITVWRLIFPFFQEKVKSRRNLWIRRIPTRRRIVGFFIKLLKPRESTEGMRFIFRIVFRPLEMEFCSSRREEKIRNPL